MILPPCTWRSRSLDFRRDKFPLPTEVAQTGVMEEVQYLFRHDTVLYSSREEEYSSPAMYEYNARA